MLSSARAERSFLSGQTLLRYSFTSLRSPVPRAMSFRSHRHVRSRILARECTCLGYHRTVSDCIVHRRRVRARTRCTSIRRVHRHRYYPYTRVHTRGYTLRLSFRSSATLAKNAERSVQRAREAPGDALNLSLIYYHREHGGERRGENVAEEVAPSSASRPLPSRPPPPLRCRCRRV